MELVETVMREDFNSLLLLSEEALRVRLSTSVVHNRGGRRLCPDLRGGSEPPVASATRKISLAVSE